MRTHQISLPLFMIFITMLLLAQIQFSSCRHIGRVISEETAKGSLRRKYSYLFSQSFSAAIHGASSRLDTDGDHDPLHIVSHRFVPSGPNPLHN